LQLKKEMAEAAMPRPKIAPAAIEPSEANIARLADGLKGSLHRNASRQKFISVARQLIRLHNNVGMVSTQDLKKNQDFPKMVFHNNLLPFAKQGCWCGFLKKDFSLQARPVRF
jgi:hypothetical protein